MSCIAIIEHPEGTTIQGIGLYRSAQCSRHGAHSLFRAKTGAPGQFCATHKRMALAGMISIRGVVHSVVDRSNYSKYDMKPHDLGTWIETNPA